MKTETILLALESAPDGSPPREFRIFPKGKFKTKKGTFTFDEKSAATVMAEYLEHGVDKHIDYCHAVFDKNASVFDKVSACWYGLDLRDGELWGANARWTPPGGQRVTNLEFRYLSPTFTVDETGRVLELLNVALTNMPATVNQRPLVAASADFSAEGMHMVNTIAVALGMSPDAPESEVLTRLSRDREVVGELVKLSGNADPKAAIAVVLGWKAGSEQLEKTQARLTTLEAEASKRDVALAVDAGERAGKITAATRDYWLGKSATEVTAYCAVAPVVQRLGRVATEEKQPIAATSLDVPTADVLTRLGMTAEEYVETERSALERGLLAF
jgi:phage I-like protein